MAEGVTVGCSLRSRDGEEEGGSRVQRGLPQGRQAAGGVVDVAGQRLVEEAAMVDWLQAAGGTIDVAGHRLAVVVGRWLRAGEGGGSGVNVRSASGVAAESKGGSD
ncbi:hypothetical protein BHM03_00022294 [Ensete ventricosum]|nr:hypothetical protein BHM03_00022294 [Ensete ventricosum]